MQCLISKHSCELASVSWWRHQIFSTLLAFCAGNSSITGEFPSQRPVSRSFDVFFDLRLNKRLSKQSWRWWFETPSRSLWHHCNGFMWRLVVCVAVSVNALSSPSEPEANDVSCSRQIEACYGEISIDTLVDDTIPLAARQAIYVSFCA